MIWIKLLFFTLAVMFTLDFIVDTIEVMSGRSEEHKKLNETKTDRKYFYVPAILWTIFYILNMLPQW